jgi:predicted DNA-binding transcriptional regulator AlpA
VVADIDALLTVKDLAKRLNLSIAAIYRMLREERGPTPIRIGHQLFFEPDEVARFERERDQK